MTQLSRQTKTTMATIMLMSFLDMVGYMAIMPSLIFYLRELGGTDEQYGLVLALPSLFAFVMMPVYGSWVDASGNKYRAPLFFGSSLCITGMLLYTTAITFPEPFGLWVLLLSRVIYGIGASSGSVMFPYLTSIVEHDQLTYCTLLLSTASSLGLAIGPLFTTAVSKVDTEWNVLGSGWVIPLNPYNSVGFLLAFNDTIGAVMMYFFLPEPKRDTKRESDSQQAAVAAAAIENASTNTKWSDVIRELRSFGLLLPLFTMYVINANYQLIETSFSPAASHGLGWGPVQTSSVLGFNSITIMICTAFSMFLTSKLKVTDATMIICGHACWFVAGTMMYYYWTNLGQVWHYVVPITIAMVGFPLIGPAAQSRFSAAIVTRPELEPIQARLQAVYGMASTLANVITPLFVGHFVLRSPQDVDSGTNPHELTAFALYIPICSGICILGWVCTKLFAPDEEGSDEAGELSVPTEASSLVRKKTGRRSSIVSIHSEFSVANEANRLRSSSIMGGSHGLPLLIPFESDGEKHRREKLWEDKKHWEEMIDNALEAEKKNAAI